MTDASAIVLASVDGLRRTERVPLGSAVDRVAAVTVVAAVDVPPFDRAAMDGYAVVATDTQCASTESPSVLRCIDRVFPGGCTVHPISEGHCAAVATGAPMPAGADAVVMVEHTHADGASVAVLAPATHRQHVGGRGADIESGRTVIEAGGWLSPGRIGALAAIGASDVDVYARPRVAIVSSGPELVEPGHPLAGHQLYDVNGHAIAALVTKHGAIPMRRRTASDTPDDVDRALDACREADLLVFSGGTSVGTHDFIVEGIAARGTILFAGIAAKPGKSTAFGIVDGVPVLALPGYPAACLLNAYVLLVPLLRRLAHLPAQPRRVATPLSRRVTSPLGKYHMSTVRIENGLAVPVFKKAGDVTSVSEADGYIVLAPGVDSLDAGTVVDVMLF